MHGSYSIPWRQSSTSLQLPGVPPGHLLVLALDGPLPEGVAQYSNAFDTGRGHRRARILKFTSSRAERPGRGADRGYSFVSMIHHTARTNARPVMG